MQKYCQRFYNLSATGSTIMFDPQQLGMTVKISKNRIPNNLLFYKYRSDLGPNDRELHTFRSCTVWSSNPSNFNDPFDCAPVPVTRTDEDLKIFAKRLRTNTDNTSITPEMRAAITKKYNEDPDAAIALLRALFKDPEFVKAFMNQAGIYSLAKEPWNRLMWSHYANSHEGYALEFDMQSLLGNSSDKDGFMPLPVIYQTTRPPMHEGSKMKRGVYLFKDDIWKYENEYRIVRNSGAGAIEFEPSLLTGVIFGAKINEEVKRKLQDAVFEYNRDRNLQVKTYQAQVSEKNYDILIPNHPAYANRGR